MRALSQGLKGKANTMSILDISVPVDFLSTRSSPRHSVLNKD